MARRLTLKQRKFVQKFVETGNGSQAAMQAYNTTNPNVAKVIASENLTKPNIRHAIELALEAAGLTDGYVAELLRESTVAGLGLKATNADTLRGIEMMLKLKNSFPSRDQKSAHLRIEMKEQLGNQSYAELVKEVRELTEKTQRLLADLK